VSSPPLPLPPSFLAHSVTRVQERSTDAVPLPSFLVSMADSHGVRQPCRVTLEEMMTSPVAEREEKTSRG
jgi:hypothetical protein